MTMADVVSGLTDIGVSGFLTFGATLYFIATAYRYFRDAGNEITDDDEMPVDLLGQERPDWK